MMIYVYDTFVPESMRGIDVEFVNAKMDGDKRPTTSNTIMEWLRGHPKPGSCLAVTHQPFVNYQDAVPKQVSSPRIHR